MSTIEERLTQIELRNTKVEQAKAWETSTTRKIGIALLTYIVVVIFFHVASVDRPWMNAIVPTMGFLLSTLSLKGLECLWKSYVYKK